MGFRLLDLVAGQFELDDSLGDKLFQTMNVFVTGLAIGGGTKPLHDLLTRIRVASSPTG
jgi:hypothetical protein